MLACQTANSLWWYGVKGHKTAIRGWLRKIPNAVPIHKFESGKHYTIQIIESEQMDKLFAIAFTSKFNEEFLDIIQSKFDKVLSQMNLTDCQIE